MLCVISDACFMVIILKKDFFLLIFPSSSTIWFEIVHGTSDHVVDSDFVQMLTSWYPIWQS